MEVVVIGAGVFGAWTALSLSQAGHQVTLLDRRGPANERSSSAGESRIIRSAYGAHEMYTVMARRSLRLWVNFFDEENRRDCFRKTGVLWMAQAWEPSISQARAIFDRLEITHRWLEAGAMAEGYPHFKLAAGTVGLFEPEAGALLAKRAIQAVVAAALRVGVHYEDAEVKPPVMKREHLAFIESADGRRFWADHFVFACGSWLPKVFDVLRTVIRPTRQDFFFFAAPDGVDELRKTTVPIWIDQTDPRIAYGFPDLGNGLKLGFHSLGAAFDPDAPWPEPGADAIAEAAEYLAGLMPFMRGARLQATHVCHYENTPNGDLLIDLHPGTQNVWLVGGGSGHGFKHAPAVAEYITGAIAGASRRELRFSLAAKQNVVSGRVL